MIYCHKCKSEHEGWDIATCRKRRNTNTNVPTLLRKPLLCDPGVQVLVEKPKKKAKTVNTAVNTDRHKPGYMADYMKKRRGNRSKVS